jgi:demethylmenaquinone methyltransferase/2-methoxy-6-polyprenyl-1,4-benzoquinol methylase
VRAYYDRRAPEYDDWYLGLGRFAGLDRPGWDEEIARLATVLAEFAPARTLDVACGTGFLTRHLRGDVVGVDRSRRMLEIAARVAPKATFVEGDALALPFPNRAFHRVFTAHFYGHLDADERRRFLGEAARVGRELVVVDSALRDDVEAEDWQERILNDGSRHLVYKRYFTSAGLAAELDGEAIHSGRWFVVVRSAL